MENIDHLLHEDHAKPRSQCVECRFQNEVAREHEAILREQQTDVDIDQALEDKYHSHGNRK